MTPDEIRLIRTSWQLVVPIADDAAALFYGRLFELDPTLRAMFTRTDLREQGRKLTQMLAVVVVGLERLDTLLPAVRALGKRHAGYGVRDEHYDTVARALLWTLGHEHGPDFTPGTLAAWTTAYGLLANVMKAAAAEQQAAA